MEKNQPTLLEYQGDNPRWAAAKQFVASTALYTIGFQLVWHGVAAVFTRQKPAQAIDATASYLKRNWKWELGFGTLLGAWDASNAYKKAEETKAQHDRLVTDNMAMRSQLNQTGQILRHVAKEVEKGKLADSQLAVNDEALPSHVARLEAQRAAEEAQQALTTVR